MTQSSVLSSETVRYQTNPKAGGSKRPSWFWLSCPGPVAWARQLFCGTRARCGYGQCTRPRRPEATGGSAGAARSGRGAQAWASVASGPSGGSRAARRRGREVEPTCAGGTAGPARGAWPSPKVLTSRCPPGHAGFLFVAGGEWGGRSHTERAAGSAGESEAPQQGSEPGLCLVTTSEPRAGTPRFLRGVPRREEEQWRAAW